MAKFFTNYSDKEFIHTWNSVSTTIAAGQTIPFREDAIGDHCAKHFVTEMMIRDGKDADIMNDAVRGGYLAKCLSTIEGAASDASADAAYMEALRAKVLAEVKEEQKKSPAKEEKKETTTKKIKKTEVKEEKFEGLEE